MGEFDHHRTILFVGGGAIVLVALLIAVSRGKGGGTENAATMIKSQQIASDYNKAATLAVIDYSKAVAIRAYDDGAKVAIADRGLAAQFLSFVSTEDKINATREVADRTVAARAAMAFHADDSRLEMERTRVNGVLALQPSIERIAITKAQSGADVAKHAADIQLQIASMRNATQQNKDDNSAILEGLGIAAETAAAFFL